MLGGSTHFEQDSALRCPSLIVKILRTTVLLSVPMALCLTGCSRPTGPVTSSQLQSLTNAVQKITNAPIMRLEQLDTGLMTVTTGSAAGRQKTDFLAKRTRLGWEITPANTTR